MNSAVAGSACLCLLALDGRTQPLLLGQELLPALARDVLDAAADEVNDVSTSREQQVGAAGPGLGPEQRQPGVVEPPQPLGIVPAAGRGGSAARPPAAPARRPPGPSCPAGRWQ